MIFPIPMLAPESLLIFKRLAVDVEFDLPAIKRRESYSSNYDHICLTFRH